MKRPTILLVNPWIHDFAAYDLWARPLGLLILGTRLRRLGWEPILMDCLDARHPDMPSRKTKPDGRGRFPRTRIAKPFCIQHIPRTFSRYGVAPEIIERDLLSLPRPKAILVTSLMTYWYPGVKETIALLRRLFSGVPVVLGGVYATLMSNHASQSCQPDEVFCGPGESRLEETLGKLTGLTTIHGNDLEDYEFSPCLDLMSEVSFLPLLTSRGCPMRCSYCASSKLFPRFISRPVEHVIHSIEEAVRNYDIKDVVVYDDAFLYDAGRRAMPILRASADKFPGLRWHAPNGLHVRYITSEVAYAMKRAGFDTIRLGFETSIDDFHKRTGGKTSKKDFRVAVRNLLAVGFNRKKIGAYVLVGVPGQTTAQIDDDVDFVLETGVVPKLAEYSPIPGTAMWNSHKQRSRYPIESEPLFHNCTLLPLAEKGVDMDFLHRERTKISEYLWLTVQKHVDT